MTKGCWFYDFILSTRLSLTCCFANGMPWDVVMTSEAPCTSMPCFASPVFSVLPSGLTNLSVSSNTKWQTSDNCLAIISAPSSTAHVCSGISRKVNALEGVSFDVCSLVVLTLYRGTHFTCWMDPKVLPLLAHYAHRPNLQEPCPVRA